ncbi:hypothetical protein ACQ4M3_39500 [Leptolyngbya sp. AN03gr2]|uniref:hypothetical protein n=1 Tax=unclassified Leptolyngbya TaxID=2650499 RepID=UPI003D31ED78
MTHTTKHIDGSSSPTDESEPATTTTKSKDTAPRCRFTKAMLRSNDSLVKSLGWVETEAKDVLDRVYAEVIPSATTLQSIEEVCEAFEWTGLPLNEKIALIVENFQALMGLNRRLKALNSPQIRRVLAQYPIQEELDAALNGNSRAAFPPVTPKAEGNIATTPISTPISTVTVQTDCDKEPEPEAEAEEESISLEAWGFEAEEADYSK